MTVHGVLGWPRRVCKTLPLKKLVILTVWSPCVEASSLLHVYIYRYMIHAFIVVVVVKRRREDDMETSHVTRKTARGTWYTHGPAGYDTVYTRYDTRYRIIKQQ